MSDLMPSEMLMPTDITAEVKQVLLASAQADGDCSTFLTAYQILDRLPEDLRERIIGERGVGSRGWGKRYSAPSVVSDAAEKLPGIIVKYLDIRGMQIRVSDMILIAGSDVCGIYRLE